MKKKLHIVFAVSCLVSLSTSMYLFFQERGKLLGNSQFGFQEISYAEISPVEALKLAEPYLEKSYQLRQENRNPKLPRATVPLTDWVSVLGKWYYISRDNNSSYTIEFYRAYAVKVHIDTGELIAPSLNES